MALAVGVRRGVTQLVVIKQHTFKRYFAACKQLDPGFEDDCFYIDVCSFNTIEIASRRKGLGPMGVPLLDHAPSDRGQNWDLAAAMNRLKGVVAPYVYQGERSSSTPPPPPRLTGVVARFVWCAPKATWMPT
jgi:hypothetical protein